MDFQKAKNWDAWKEHDTSEERAIFRFDAEKEQIEIKPMRVKGYKEIHVRGIFVAGCPENYKVHLRLGDHRPMVVITAPEGTISFIANLDKVTEK